MRKTANFLLVLVFATLGVLALAGPARAAADDDYLERWWHTERYQLVEAKSLVFEAPRTWQVDANREGEIVRGDKVTGLPDHQLLYQLDLNKDDSASEIIVAAIRKQPDLTLDMLLKAVRDPKQNYLDLKNGSLDLAGHKTSYLKCLYELDVEGEKGVKRKVKIGAVAAGLEHADSLIILIFHGQDQDFTQDLVDFEHVVKTLRLKDFTPTIFK
ncbi:MAG: hypothetical protein KQJ78_08075 [Deltaproteobacteria bacterium]|nr:hypothetical protein [Deltaproteobacteria bacterium]